MGKAAPTKKTKARYKTSHSSNLSKQVGKFETGGSLLPGVSIYYQIGQGFNKRLKKKKTKSKSKTKKQKVNQKPRPKTKKPKAKQRLRPKTKKPKANKKKIDIIKS